MYSPNGDVSSSATRTGGQDDLAPDHVHHDHQPHVYVVYWPDIATIKVGITSGQDRWQWWTKRGGVLIATTDPCCMNHARGIEKWMLGRIARYGAPAFRSEQDARLVLGRKRGGYTECYRLVQSPRFGDTPEHPYDYERAYGLILPHEIEHDLDHYDFARYEITDSWDDHSRRSA
jgi:hypothetical protein